MEKKINSTHIMKCAGIKDFSEDSIVDEDKLAKCREESMKDYYNNKITSRGELNYSKNNLFYLPRAIMMSVFDQVVTLNISKNSFTEINDNMVKSLPNLKELIADSNKITFITSEIYLLKDTLKKLILGNNNLKEVTPEISQLENLQFLLLNDNKIEYLPPEICELQNLKMLDVTNNLLSSLPYELGNLKNLRRLNMANNSSLQWIPTSLCHLDKLERIHLEWLVYAPKVVDLSINEHGQSENTRSTYSMRSETEFKREKAFQFKHILKEFDTQGKETVSFIEFIKCDKDNIDYKDSRKRTKINIAAKEGHYLVVQELLKHGADPNLYDKDKFAALGLAIREENDRISDLLLDSSCASGDGDKPRIELDQGAGNLGSPLHISIVKHKADIVIKMIKMGANINMKDNEGNTPLHQLISIYSKNELQSLNLLKILVKNKADCASRNNLGLTPLMLAIKRKQKGAIIDILKQPKRSLGSFKLNAIEKSSGYNSLYLLLKHKFTELAENTFLKGGNSLIYLPGGWKRCCLDADSYKTKYIIRKMRKFQLRKKFNVSKVTTLTAGYKDLVRNRIVFYEDPDPLSSFKTPLNEYHSVGQLIKKKKVQKMGFLKKMCNDSRRSTRIKFVKHQLIGSPE
ncbi:unnamed protein product [Moneuplotes crassus]|uniref:Disease resistance R13L4/SHOC-2-like LRR domain-containing protein n=1 Tax=Euplotes crassus TaxID=5936 RepID=A0AAD1X878_EUPCR|nr:unnamed protein product [Moneuplotes crassus]